MRDTNHIDSHFENIKIIYRQKNEQDIHLIEGNNVQIKNGEAGKKEKNTIFYFIWQKQ